MSITLRIVVPESLPPGQEKEVTFSLAGGTQKYIGRSSDKDWVLCNDYVGRDHGILELRADGYYFKDHSTNGTSIQCPGQEEKYLQNAECKLNEGDILYIGEYDIEVVSIRKEVEPPPAPIESPADEKPEPHYGPRDSDAAAARQHSQSFGQAQPYERPRQEQIHVRAETDKPHGESPQEPHLHEQFAEMPANEGYQHAVYAFLQGAGVADNVPVDRLDPETMLMLGAAFRETMAGLIKLIEVRKRFKHETNLPITRLGAMNNPLKFSQDPNVVLEFMLLRRKGYIPATGAVKEAFEDIEAFLLALWGSMQEGMDNTLQHLSPQEIERQLVQEGGTFNLSGKKWKIFMERYNELDINKLLCDELAEAYDEQLRRIKSSLPS
ncbi:MAG: FHA domain-containing protein [Gammaproteobacteria bacterium]|nr:FHA domain-containing protein [Gammaproteobacteria bacterium]